ncbi:hypothetical protein M446_0845 [Methylobacterium sp. 4-46]|uniref:hypothetical protein n=1 Tax=unclassified Methylobacterium TaxID=2615210 RepID=UPI000165C93B|nr:MULTISPECIES: hypothetical protein [Methylobacterium]ACA15398.1 hypothetical protein M446_0845 [Methylobacterium sp. 4-46]WFT81118.1 hypothetical protein QA634_04230 [Methylobacterium nodulans]
MRLIRLAPLALLATALAAPAGAEDLPREASFRITYTSTNPVPGKPVQLGPTRSHAVGVSIMAAVNQSGGKLLHNMAGRCSSSAMFDSDAKTFENQGYCDYVDADGDHVYERYAFAPQPMSARLKGTGEWIGGTGKFTGLSGSFDIQASRLSPLAEGVAQSVGEKTGTYVIRDKVADAK